jgi:transcriptional regulator with GAF, ATPase, and Fis domain
LHPLTLELKCSENHASTVAAVYRLAVRKSRMVPKLVCVAGPLRGREFDLKGPVRLGHASDNDISIQDPGVSDRQCEIVSAGSRLDLVNLDSRNVTSLNGTPVNRSVLADGDEIRIGDSAFLLVLGEDQGSREQPVVQFDERDSWVTRCSSALDTEESVPGSARAARELKALLSITSVLASVKRLEELEQKLLETITGVIPADRGAIILVGESIEQFTSIFGWDRVPDGHHPVEVSRAVIDRALRDRVAVLSGDVEESQNGEDRQAPRRRRSLLAVPLVVFDRTVGVVYLDADNTRVRLDEGHLEWLKAFGRVAAVALDNARRAQWLENENRRLREELDLDHSMVGESLAMQEVYRFIAKVAPSTSTVLIRGESGTGKELVARAIHRNSRRADRPFVAVNCAAVTETLLESEMFGHEKGAFTGAMAQKKGRIELADSGTLFLDEITELAPNLQAKLLRVLQEREFERVGGTRPIRVNIRVVAATNQDLEKAMNAGRFRPDLYYRLNVVSITLPSLRERREDIPLLANYFAARHCERSNRPKLTISPDAMVYLSHYDWPGNVRELEHAMERAVVLGSGDAIRPENLPEDILEIELPHRSLLPHFHEMVKRTKRDLILKALKQAGGNYTEAAKGLGLQPTYLHRLIRNLNLRGAIREQIP